MSENDFKIRGQSFQWGQQTYLMGILNVTPDSFSDGGEFNSLDAAVVQAKQMVADGANMIDVGGQSTRPGAVEISLEEELERVVPIVKRLREELPRIPISVDTTRAKVAQAAVEVGADIINDISGGTFDPEMFAVVAQLDVPIILMHLRGTPQTMQTLTDYEDLVGEIYTFLETQITKAEKEGVARSRRDPLRGARIIIDPGIGFAKTAAQNLELIRRLEAFRPLGVPILVGVSRKSFIGRILNQDDPKQRVWGTAAACCGAIAHSADILRVHDVAPMYDVCRVADAIWREGV